MGKRFVTIFPFCQDVHLTKDVGQIPFFLYKLFGYNSVIVSYRNNEIYNNLNGEVKGLKLDFIENKGRVSFLEKSVLKYIHKNAREIDILGLYHFSKFTFVYGILYKFLNPKGFLLIKLDAYNKTFSEENEVKHSTQKVKNTLFKILERRFLKKFDLLSIENSDGLELFKKKYPQTSDKLIYLPVGVNDLFIVNAFRNRIRDYNEKENIILTVGRIGEYVKNHEMILRALTKTNMKDWKMVFVGPVNESFMNYYNKLCGEYPQLKSIITFTGEIKDRVELYEWYNRSKIFCMTSWNESFSNAISEAFYFGNYIIGTEGVMSMKDITDGGKYGTSLKADNDKALADTIQKLIDNESTLSVLYPEIVSFSHKHFTWSQIIGKLHQQIEDKTTHA